MKKEIKKMLFSGGGTGGSVAPLLALVNSLKKEGSYEFLFVGTKNGVEKEMVKSVGLKYKSITAGKLRRYFSLENFIDPFKILIGFFESLALLTDEKPDVIISAGSFVSVPLVWAGWLFNIPVLIHQQDARPGLANKLMAPCAKKITVTFKKSLADYGQKAAWVGNPIQLINNSRELSKGEILKKFNLKDDMSTVLITGGGTGAAAINNLVYESLDELVKFCQIVHLTGKNKTKDVKKENYQQIELLEQNKMYEIMRVSDLVITRAGLSTLTEISYFSIPAMIIPMPESHQEDNAEIFSKKEAALVLDQRELNKEKFVSSVKNILKDKVLKEKLSKNISGVIKKGASEEIIKIIKDL